MANEENLIPINKRTKSEAREISKKGGIASGEARRKKKSMKQAMNALLSLPASEECKDCLDSLGIDLRDIDNQTLMMVAAFQKAIKGNIDAMKFIASITGSNAMSEAERKKNKLSTERLKLEKEELDYKRKKDDEQW